MSLTRTAAAALALLVAASLGDAVVIAAGQEHAGRVRARGLGDGAGQR